MALIKNPGPAYFANYTAADFKANKSRQYVNVKTGDIVSRRQFDKFHGALAKANLPSYEAKAKALAAERGKSAAQSGIPGRGRSTASGPNVFKTASPNVNKQSREIAIPFHLYRGDDMFEFIRDAERFRPGFVTAVKGVQQNEKIASCGIRAEWHNPLTGGHGWMTFLKTHNRESFAPDYDEMIEFFYSGTNSHTVGAEISPLIFHVVFRDEYIPHAKVKQLSTKRKRAKAKAKAKEKPKSTTGKKRRLIR